MLPFLDEKIGSKQFKNLLKERDIKYIKLDDAKNLFQVFEFRKPLGQGSFGIVVGAVEKSTSKHYAIKIITKNYIAGSPQLQEIKREIQILRSVNHPNIIWLDRVYETPKKIYMVFELCRETLFIKFKNCHPFSEKNTKYISKQLCSAVQYLHKYDIVHRDIKLENILLADNPDDPNDEFFIKLTDFGLSIIKVGAGIKGMMCSRVGTVLYMAPEILLDHTYSELCDIWSIGVILYTLTFGKYPFPLLPQTEMVPVICETEPEYPKKMADEDCIDLLKSMLVKDPAKRITAVEMSKHPWLIETTMHRRKDQTVIDYMKQWKSEMMTVSTSHFDLSGTLPLVNDDLLDFQQYSSSR